MQIEIKPSVFGASFQAVLPCTLVLLPVSYISIVKH